MNISNSVILNVINHITNDNVNKPHTSFSLEDGCIVMHQDRWTIRFEENGIVKLNNPECSIGENEYDANVYYAKNGDFIEDYKILYEVQDVVFEQITTATLLYEHGHISLDQRNERIKKATSVDYRKKLFDEIKEQE